MTTQDDKTYQMVAVSVDDHEAELDNAASGAPTPLNIGSSKGSIKQVGSFRASMAKSPNAKARQDIKWSQICFDVKDKKILNNCFGYVPSGKLCAIMGPSGSGKSSLLNVLAGRSSSSMPDSIVVKGRVEVSGKKINPVEFRKNIAYVMQEDALMATATPREALEFSALMRLPPNTPKEDIDDIVTCLLNDLGIMDCADVFIGNVLIKGISGGQKKRTSVGVEMITNPSLLFLDEPTSGLDSFAAYNLIELLKAVASDGSAILATIHQPSSEIFQLFDIAIFLVAGTVLYSGPVVEMAKHFSRCNFVIPEHHNPADYVMMLSQTETFEALTASGVVSPNPYGNDKGDIEKQVESSNSIMTFSTTENADFTIQSGFFRQLYYLTAREFLSTKRDKVAMIIRFFITIFLNLLYGLIFKGVGSRDLANFSNFQSHAGSITMVSIATMFGSAQPTMFAIPFERPMFMREYSTGTYGAPAYFIAKAFIELPVVYAQTIVQYLLVYYLCGWTGGFGLMSLTAWGLGVASASMGVFLGCVVTDVKAVAESAPLLFVPQILFAGFFIKINLIPVFIRWAQYLCSLKYALNILLILEFNPSSSACSSSEPAHTNCENILSENKIQIEDWWIYVIIIGCLFLIFRVMGAYILAKRAKRFY